MWIHEKIVIWGNIKMKRKKIWISVIASMLIGTVSVAASSGIELHEFFNENFDYPEKPLKYKHIRRISD